MYLAVICTLIETKLPLVAQQQTPDLVLPLLTRMQHKKKTRGNYLTATKANSGCDFDVPLHHAIDFPRG